MSTQAKETITLLYAFSPSDTTGNYSRILANELNNSQSKYNFVYDAKPGAGGTIAVNEVLNSKPANTTILHHSTAFFVRPNIFPKESWDINAFEELFLHCSAPLVVAGSNVKTWAEVDAKQSVSIGISGLGVTTHLMAVQLQKKHPNLLIVPFKSTTDATASMYAGQTDLAIGFAGDIRKFVETGKASVLGITGTKGYKGFPTLTSQGHDKIFEKMVVGQHYAVPKSWSAEKKKEVYDMIMKVANNKKLTEAYQEDLCVQKHLPYNQLNTWFTEQTDYWKLLSSEVKIEEKK